MYEWQGEAAVPNFDLARAASYQGKYILIGVSYYSHAGEFIEQVQMHGTIESVSNAGLQIRLRGARDGETWLMPPSLDSMSEAKPGVYTLRSTGEEIKDPDLLATWSVTKPPSD